MNRTEGGRPHWAGPKPSGPTTFEDSEDDMGAKLVSLALAAALIGGVAVSDAQAFPPPRPGPGWGHGPGWGYGPGPGGWHHGYWRHEWYDGRFGWWWVVGPTWYFYAEPVYPYPPAPYVVTTVAPAGYAYYCSNPSGYYPAITQCLVPWQLVAMATPPVVMAPPVVVAPAPVVTAPVVTAPAAPAVEGNKTAGGTVLGAIGGAVAGAQFGRGTGRVASAALGTLLGAFIGHEVGQSLDRADQLAAQQAAQQAYVVPVGQTITWNTPNTSHAGTITPTREGVDASNNLCREFKQTVTIDGRSEEVTSTACRKSDGSWVLIGR